MFGIHQGALLGFQVAFIESRAITEPLINIFHREVNCGYPLGKV